MNQIVHWLFFLHFLFLFLFFISQEVINSSASISIHQSSNSGGYDWNYWPFVLNREKIKVKIEIPKNFGTKNFQNSKKKNKVEKFLILGTSWVKSFSKYSMLISMRGREERENKGKKKQRKKKWKEKNEKNRSLLYHLFLYIAFIFSINKGNKFIVYSYYFIPFSLNYIFLIHSFCICWRWDIEHHFVIHSFGQKFQETQAISPIQFIIELSYLETWYPILMNFLNLFSISIYFL